MLHAASTRSRLRLLPSRHASTVALLAAVPALFAIYAVVGASDYRLVYALLAVMMVAALARGLANFFARRALLAYHALFGLLLLTSVPTLLRDGAWAMYVQVETLTICYLWSSAFVLAFVFLRTREDVAAALVTLRHVGTAVTLSVYVAA